MLVPPVFVEYQFQLRFCDLCFAERPTKKSNLMMNYKNMGPSAPYRLAPMDHATYMANEVVSEYSQIAGWHLHNNVLDIMHNLFLGTGRDFIASGVRVLIEKGYFDKPGLARGSDDMFVEINLAIHETFRQHRFLRGIPRKIVLPAVFSQETPNRWCCTWVF